jgi:hypothetical protein
MADGLENLFFDISGAAENPFKEQPAEAPTPAAAAETGEAATTPTETPAVIADPDEDFTVEEVQDKLREEWGSDFDQKYEEASKAVQQFFKNDDEGLEWFSRRVGSHPQAVKLAYRLAAIYSGNGLPEKSSAPNATALDAELKKFEKGGEYFDRWLGGDTQLNERRIELYRRRHGRQAITLE